MSQIFVKLEHRMADMDVDYTKFKHVTNLDLNSFIISDYINIVTSKVLIGIT